MKFSLQSTRQFNDWFNHLKDRSVKNQVLSRLARVENGNFGDCKAVASNLFELRCFFGGGLRIYYTLRNQNIVLLLTGGDKSSQSNDIEKAKQLLLALED